MLKRKHYLILLGFMSILSIILIYFNQNQTIALEQIEVDSVNTGEFIRTSEGFGQFESQKNRIVTAPYQGRVKAINFLSGESVSQGDILFTLENTDLARGLANAKMNFQRSQLLHQKLEVELAQLELSIENDIEDAESDLAIAQLDAKAQHKLYQQHVVSELAYRQTEAKLAKISRSLSALKRNLSVQKSNRLKQLKIESSLVAQEQSKVRQYQMDIDRMTIRSSINGVIQQINVTIGDSLNMGEELGRLGSVHPDVAKLKFSAQDAKGLTIGNDVELSYLDQKFVSKISRIEPELSDGYIVAYVDLNNQHVKDAKIELNLVAKATIEKLQNVTWVRRPVASQSQSNEFVIFKVIGNKAIKNIIKVQTVYNHFLIVESGLNDRDKIIISNIREFEHLDEIEIQ